MVFEPVGATRLYSHELQSDLSRNIHCFKVASNGIRCLVLEYAQISALRRDPALTSSSIPKRYERSRLLARLDLEDYFVHGVKSRDND